MFVGFVVFFLWDLMLGVYVYEFCFVFLVVGVWEWFLVWVEEWLEMRVCRCLLMNCGGVLVWIVSMFFMSMVMCFSLSLLSCCSWLLIGS